jgi:hypothetical protein
LLVFPLEPVRAEGLLRVGMVHHCVGGEVGGQGKGRAPLGRGLLRAWQTQVRFACAAGVVPHMQLVMLVLFSTFAMSGVGGAS